MGWGMIESAGYVSENPQVACYLFSLGWVPVQLENFLGRHYTIVTEPSRPANECQTLIRFPESKYRSGTTIPISLFGAKFRHPQLAGHIAGKHVKNSNDINVKKALTEALTLQMILAICKAPY
jgi:hypothetical protein